MPYSAQVPRWLARVLALAAVYAVIGLLALRLSIAPDYASPLYPGAGLALAAVLCWGRRVAPGIALGSMAVNVLLSQERGLPSLLAPTIIGLGAMLQALAGAAMVRRWVSQPLELTEPRDLARFYLLGACVACLISPSVACSALLLIQAVTPDQALTTWCNWWLGDTVGVLIGAPIALTLIGQPRSTWAPRRLSVALPMLLTTLLMALATLKLGEWDQQREQINFEREADAAAQAMEAALREPLSALEATRGLLLVNPQPSRPDFQRGTAAHLLPGSRLLALGWAPLVERSGLSTFDRAARAEGLDNYQAHDRQRSGDLQPPAEEAMLAIRLIEPLPRNAGALGVNIRSIPASREALGRAQSSGLPAATAGFQLSQDHDVATGVVVYQALYQGAPAVAADRAQALRGMVFVTLRPDQLVKGIAGSLPAYLQICLVDTDPQAARRRLAGPEHCETQARPALSKLRGIQFAGRAWDILVFAPAGVPSAGASSSRPFSLVGLLCTALVGALLLTITGRTRRVEVLVAERTAALETEVRERERASQALAESEQRFRNIFDKAPIGIVFADLNGQPEDVNPHFCRMLGYRREELTQMRSLTFTHPDDRAEDVRLARLLIEGKIGMYRRQKRYLTHDGHTLHGRALVSLLRDAQGHPHRLVGVVEDITDQRKMQELEHAREAAEAASRAKNEFLSRMSHELRTPLNAMLGFTQLLDMDREHPLGERQRGWAGQIQHAGWHLLEMINDTLDLSRIESGALRLALERQDLHALLDEALALLEEPARARGIHIDKAPAAAAPHHVLGDATRIKQVLTNLLSNAIKYNREGGEIRLALRQVGETALALDVTDTGPGLSPAQLAQLFQPFNRLGRERSNIEGTGIGLVISKRLAELMGGTLRASSSEGQGATFCLQLPIAPAAPSPAEATPAAKSGAPEAARKRLVYIEDNAVNVEVMSGILEQRSQLQLEVYPDGASGLAGVLAAPPDLLLLDMQLPDTDGLSLLKALRATPQGATLPVIAVSANALPEQIERCRQAGADHYLTKPVDVRQLLALLDRMLGEPPPTNTQSSEQVR